MNRHNSGYLALLLWGLCVPACSQDEAAPCALGEPVACPCRGGESGTQVCLADGSLSPCLCSAAPRRCSEPGVSLACACDDGAVGEQVCLADGALSRCRCAAVSDPAPAPLPDAGMPPGAGGVGGAGPSEPIVRCCHDLGSCLPAELVPAGQRGLLGPDQCPDVRTDLCVPDQLVDPRGFSLQPCRSSGLVEGRCVPDCLPQVSDLAAGLPRDLCPEHHLCTPCFDPFTGSPTGICGLSNDPGPVEPPTTYGRCCESIGQCVPGSLVDDSQRELFGSDVCEPARGLVCVPDAFLPGDFLLDSCRASGDLEGRCMPACLPSVEALGGALTGEGCHEAFLCVPCFDPLSGMATGACGLSLDPGPSEPPVVYPRCCDEGMGPLGTCLAASLLPPELADALPQESCPSSEERCVPQAQVEDPQAPLMSCSTLLGGAGACLPACLIPNQAFLIQGICSDGELCVPCMTAGEPTGVCPNP